MKKVLLTFVLLVGVVFGLLAQKLTYQAAIRDNSQQLVTNTAVKATVTITFTTGIPATYSTEVNGTTNLHGLLSIEFGGDALLGRDWTDATIAVKVVNADNEGTVYVNGEPRPVSAVPYALSVNGQSIQNYLTEHNYVDLAKLNDTLGAYSTTTAMDARHYLTSDSAVITGMQSNISKNANDIGNLIRHTAKAAIRDSVAGQVHDSIATVAAKAHEHGNKALLDTYEQTEANLADAVSKKHAHANAAILNNTTATYTDADSAKLKGDISKNANDIGNLILHTAKAAIRDSVAGQIHDSIANIAAKSHIHGNKALLDTYTQTEDNLEDAVAKKHAHANAAVLAATTATYTDADSAKLKGDISKNANDIGNLILHTAKAAIRDSVAGQIHDSIANIAAISHTHANKTLLDAYTQTEANLADAVAKKHAHDNADILNNTTATYTDADSAKLKGDISKNANDIGNLILHTAKAAIRDSVAGQIHDSIANIAAKSHTHANKALLDAYTQTETNLADAVAKKHAHANAAVLAATTAPYTDADSAKLKGIAAGAEVNVQSDWNQTSTTADDYIKNKPTIPTVPTNVSAFTNDAGYVKETELLTKLDAINNAIDNLPLVIDSLSCVLRKVSDVDGNTYTTVYIGSQCWMAENLRTTKYADGTSITLSSTSTSTETAYRYYPNGNSSNVSTYGYLYNWKAVMRNSSSSSSNPSGVQGICPTGWHVPSDAEWTQLTDYVSNRSEYVCGSNNGNIAKALASTTGWSSYNTTCAVGNNPSANNATGFNAVPAGYTYSGSIGNTAWFWSATQHYESSYSATIAYGRYLKNSVATVTQNDTYKSTGFSVRCLRD